MSSEIDIKAREIFLNALEKQGSAQIKAFVNQACGKNELLRKRVAELFQAQQNAGEFLQTPDDAFEQTMDVPSGSNASTRSLADSGDSIGSQIGPYKLLQEIGEGGMGTVYMAEQEKPVRRRVALKIIKPGMDSKQVVARFEGERQALALMDHPNITNVLEAGTTDSGLPFFVMELIKGQPITQYCDEQKLSIEQRLELFRSVCSAVQHAHQKGILHRDLKPSNILVAEFDNVPVPKIIDFGLAKALSQRLTEKTMFTQLGQVVGTLEYMSPEQSRMNQLDVDTRSDIYSLGVLLYELLTGDTPFNKKRLQSAAFDELLRIIREEEPPKPSTKLSSSESMPSVAANRGVEAQKLGSIVRGELDWIAMKSLEKERSRRYGSASDFAQDIERYLNHEPVLACPQSAAYRARKFVRKNRPAVVAVSAIALILLAASGVSLYLAFRAINAEKLASDRLVAVEAEQKKTAEEAKTNWKMVGILTDAFESVMPEMGADATISAKDVLDNARQALVRIELKDASKARMLHGLCGAYLGIGETEAALSAAKECLALRERSLGPTDQGTLIAMGNLALAHLRANQAEKALPLAERTFALMKKHLGPRDPVTLRIMGNLTDAYISTGRKEQALELARKTATLCTDELGEGDETTWRAMGRLGTCYAIVGRHAEAIAQLEKSLGKHTQYLKRDHPATLQTMHNLAASYWKVGRQPDAIRLFEETVALSRAKRVPNHPDTIKSALVLAFYYRSESVGRFAKALKIHDEILKYRRSKHGDRDEKTVWSISQVGYLRMRIGNFQEALPLLQEAATARTEMSGGLENSETLLAWQSLAECKMRMAEYAAAIEDYERIVPHVKLIGKEQIGTKQNLLNNAVWSCVATSEHRDKMKPEWLDLFRELCVKNPNGACYNTLALAEYFDGNDNAAIAAATESKRLMGFVHPLNLATLAMAHKRLGNKQKANTFHEQFTETVKHPAFRNDPEVMSFASEVEEAFEEDKD